MTHLSIETDDGQILSKIPLSDTYALITDRDGVTIQGVAAEALTPSEELIERAEKAEQERDEARSERDLLALRAKLTPPVEQSRGFTAEDVDDEMVLRFRVAEERMTGDTTSKEGVRLLLTAALTPAPALPDGAEELAADIRGWEEGPFEGGWTDSLAQHLAAIGWKKEN